MTLENEDITTTDDDFVLEGESEFDFPDKIEPIAIELSVDEDETGVDDALDSTLDEDIEEKIVQMRNGFIAAKELEERYKDSDVVEGNVEIKELFDIAGLDCNEVIFNTTNDTSPLNKTALDIILKEIAAKYAELFANVTGKVTSTVETLEKGNEDIPRDDLETIDSIRYRASTLQTNYIKRDNGVINAFTTPLSEFRDLLESDYAVSPNFDIIYNMCDKILDAKDKPFCDTAAYLEILYKDWLSSTEKLANIKLLLNEDFDGSFKSRLDVLNTRDKLEAISINISRVKSIYDCYPAGNIFDLIVEVMFNEL